MMSHIRCGPLVGKSWPCLLYIKKKINFPKLWRFLKHFTSNHNPSFNQSFFFVAFVCHSSKGAPPHPPATWIICTLLSTLSNIVNFTPSPKLSWFFFTFLLQLHYHIVQWNLRASAIIIIIATVMISNNSSSSNSNFFTLVLLNSNEDIFMI